ncbi:hypothetical protein CAPTEDRAFT_107367, partial [Capitella teleta]
TEASFRAQEDEEHHTGISPLSVLPIDLVVKFPQDYLHLICLGVMRTMMALWTEGRYSFKLSHQTKVNVSNHLESIRSFAPKEFVRQPRSILERGRWKATEFRNFLLYTGPLDMVDVIPEEVYKHFLMLSSAITVLCDPILCHKLVDFAENLLIKFVQHFSDLYGPDHVLYNVHNVVHLANDVRCHGPLDSFSAFPFENCLGHLK